MESVFNLNLFRVRMNVCVSACVYFDSDILSRKNVYLKRTLIKQNRLCEKKAITFEMNRFLN